MAIPITVAQFVQWLFQPKTPKLHASTHEEGGVDELSLDPEEAYTFFMGH